MENWFRDLEIHTKTVVVQWEVCCKSNRGELSQRRCFTPEHRWRGTTAAQKMPFTTRGNEKILFLLAAFTKNTTHGFVRKRLWRCADKVAEWRVIKPINGNEVAQWCLVTQRGERKKEAEFCVSIVHTCWANTDEIVSQLTSYMLWILLSYQSVMNHYVDFNVWPIKARFELTWAFNTRSGLKAV